MNLHEAEALYDEKLSGYRRDKDAAEVCARVFNVYKKPIMGVFGCGYAERNGRLVRKPYAIEDVRHEPALTKVFN